MGMSGDYIAVASGSTMVRIGSLYLEQGLNFNTFWKNVRLIIFSFIFTLLISCKKDVIIPPVITDPVEQPDTTQPLIIIKISLSQTGILSGLAMGRCLKETWNDQETNAGKILKYSMLTCTVFAKLWILHASDEWCAIVTGDEFRYNVSIIPLFQMHKNWFLCITEIFSNVKTRPFMGLGTAGIQLFRLQRFRTSLRRCGCKKMAAGIPSFFLIHAKANADADSYNRRNGAIRIKDSLICTMEEKLMMLGDLNDHLNGSILSGKNSPYISFINDANYDVVTLPLNTTGNQSTINFNNSVMTNRSSVKTWQDGISEVRPK